MNEWRALMQKKIEFNKAMNVIVDTYQHHTAKDKLDMKDIDDLVSCIRIELYRKNGIITEKEYEALNK